MLAFCLNSVGYLLESLSVTFSETLWAVSEDVVEDGQGGRGRLS